MEKWYLWHENDDARWLAVAERAPTALPRPRLWKYLTASLQKCPQALRPIVCPCACTSKSKNLQFSAIFEPKMRSEHYLDRTAVTPTAAKDTAHDSWLLAGAPGATVARQGHQAALARRRRAAGQGIGPAPASQPTQLSHRSGFWLTEKSCWNCPIADFPKGGFCNVPDVTDMAASTLRWTVLLSKDITSKDISEVGLLRHTAALPLMVHT